MCTEPIKVPFRSIVFPGSELIMPIPILARAVSRIRIVISSLYGTGLEEFIKEAEIPGIELLYGEFIRVENDLKVSLEKQATRSTSRMCTLPFSCLNEHHFDPITIRILFGGTGKDPIEGHFLIDYFETNTILKGPYFKRIRQISCIKSPFASSKRITLDVYIPGPVYELFFTIRDSSGTFYTNLIQNITLLINDRERFNLPGGHLQYIEPFKKYGAHSDTSVMYSFSLPDGGGQTELSHTQRFIFDFYPNTLVGTLTVWGLSRNMLYNGKRVFDSHETPIYYKNDQYTTGAVTPTPLSVYCNNTNSVITVLTNTPGQPRFKTFPGIPSTTQTYSSLGHSDVQCTFNYPTFIQPPSSLLTTSTKLYTIQDGNNVLYYTRGASNVISIDNYGNVYSLDTSTNILRYGGTQRMTNVSSLPATYLGFSAIPLRNGTIYTTNNGIIASPPPGGIVMVSAVADSTYFYTTNGSNLYVYNQTTGALVATQTTSSGSAFGLLALTSTSIILAQATCIWIFPRRPDFGSPTTVNITRGRQVVRLFVNDVGTVYTATTRGTGGLYIETAGTTLYSLEPTSGTPSWFDASFSGTYFTLIVGGPCVIADQTIPAGIAYINNYSVSDQTYLTRGISPVTYNDASYYSSARRSMVLPYTGSVIITRATQRTPSNVDVVYQTTGWPQNVACTLNQNTTPVAQSSSGTFSLAPVSNLIPSPFNLFVSASSPVGIITSPAISFTYVTGIITLGDTLTQLSPTSQRFSYTYVYSNTTTAPQADLYLTYSSGGQWVPVSPGTATITSSDVTFSNLSGAVIRLEANQTVIGTTVSSALVVRYASGTITITSAQQVSSVGYTILYMSTGWPVYQNVTLYQSATASGPWAQVGQPRTVFVNVSLLYSTNYIRIGITDPVYGTVTSDPVPITHVSVPTIKITTVTQTSPTKQTIQFTASSDGWTPSSQFGLWQLVEGGTYSFIVYADPSGSSFTDVEGMPEGLVVAIGRQTPNFGVQYSPPVTITYLHPKITNLVATQTSTSTQTISFTQSGGWGSSQAIIFYLYYAPYVAGVSQPLAAAAYSLPPVFTNVRLLPNTNVCVHTDTPVVGSITSDSIPITYVTGTISVPTLTQINTGNVQVSWSNTVFTSAATVSISTSPNISGPWTLRIDGISITDKPKTVTTIPHNTYVQLYASETTYGTSTSVSTQPFTYSNSLSISSIYPITSSTANVNFVSTGFTLSDTVSVNGVSGPMARTGIVQNVPISSYGNVSVTISTQDDPNVGVYTSPQYLYAPVNAPLYTSVNGNISWGYSTQLVIQQSNDQNTWSPIGGPYSIDQVPVTLTPTQSYLEMILDDTSNTAIRTVTPNVPITIGWVYIPGNATVQAQYTAAGTDEWTSIGVTRRFDSQYVSVPLLPRPTNIRIVITNVPVYGTIYSLTGNAPA